MVLLNSRIGVWNIVETLLTVYTQSLWIHVLTYTCIYKI